MNREKIKVFIAREILINSLLFLACFVFPFTWLIVTVARILYWAVKTVQAKATYN